VISSCGHAVIITTLRRPQEVSGVEKIYALVAVSTWLRRPTIICAR